MRDVHEQCGHTMHRITNVVVDPSARGVTARSYVDAIVLGPDNQTGARSAGYYDDELVPTDDGWRSCAAVSRWCSSRACPTSSRRRRPVANTAVSTRFPMHCSRPASAKVRRASSSIPTGERAGALRDDDPHPPEVLDPGCRVSGRPGVGW